MIERFKNDPHAVWEHLFDNAVIGIALVSKDGTWLKVNRKMQEILGYTEYEFLRTDLQSLTHPEDRSPDEESMHNLGSGQIKTYTMRKRYITKNGDIVWIRSTMHPYYGPSLSGEEEPQLLYYVSQVEPLEKDELKIIQLFEKQFEVITEHLNQVFKILANIEDEAEQQAKDKWTLFSILDRHANWIVTLILGGLFALATAYNNYVIQSYEMKKFMRKIESSQEFRIKNDNAKRKNNSIQHSTTPD